MEGAGSFKTAAQPGRERAERAVFVQGQPLARSLRTQRLPLRADLTKHRAAGRAKKEEGDGEHRKVARKALPRNKAG